MPSRNERGPESQHQMVLQVASRGVDAEAGMTALLARHSRRVEERIKSRHRASTHRESRSHRRTRPGQPSPYPAVCVCVCVCMRRCAPHSLTTKRMASYAPRMAFGRCFSCTTRSSAVTTTHRGSTVRSRAWCRCDGLRPRYPCTATARCSSGQLNLQVASRLREEGSGRLHYTREKGVAIGQEIGLRRSIVHAQEVGHCS